MRPPKQDMVVVLIVHIVAGAGVVVATTGERRAVDLLGRA